MSELAELLRVASDGERDKVLTFLKAFKTSSLWVPAKEQSPPYTSLPPYPERPLNILALRENEVIIVPVFSSPDLCEIWAQRKLLVRKLNCSELITLLPDSWWIALNPGDEFRKDFSPWELQRILGDQDDLEEIATELELEHGVEPLAIRKVLDGEFRELLASLRHTAQDQSDIKQVYLAIEDGQTVEGTKVQTLLIGLRVRDSKSTQPDKIRTLFRDLAAPYLIGACQLKVLVGVGFSDLELGVFSDIPPAYSRDTL